MLAARWMLAVMAAVAAQVAAAQSMTGASDGGVPDDTLVPLIDDGSAPVTAAPPTAPAPRPAVEAVVAQAATRTSQPLEWAPSVVTVLTRADLRALGYRSLGEVLRNTVGFDLNDDGAWPDTGVRGVNETGSHGNLLKVMLDGHDMAWRQFGWNLHDRSWVDLEDVERIEIVRGPAAAVWGTGALGATVNVVTRDWTRLRGAEATYGVQGAFTGQSASTRVGGVVGDVSLYGSFSYTSDDADPVLAPLREPLLLDSEPFRVAGARQETAVVNLKARYRDFQLWLHHGHSDLGSPLFALSVVGGDDTRLVTDRTIARLLWARELLPALDVRAELALDQVGFTPATVYENQPLSAIPGDPSIDVAGRFLRKMQASDRRTELHAQASYAFSQTLRAAGGVDVEWLSGVRFHFPELYAAQALAPPRLGDFWAGAWLEAQFHPLEMLELTAGARYDLDQLSGSILTPRAAAVLHLPADIYVKGLYGSGYRAPSIQDLFAFRRNVAYGNPSLRPETSITGELEIGYAPGALRVSVAGFLTRLNGLIAFEQRNAGTPLEVAEAFPLSQLPDPGAVYLQKENGGFLTTAGVEAEVHFEPVSFLALKGHGTLRRPRDRDDQRLSYAPEWTAGAAAIWRLDPRLTATFRVLAIGERLVPATGLSEPGFTSWLDSEDPTTSAPASLVGTVVLRALLSERVSLELKLDNVTDAWWYDAGPAVLYPQRRFQASAFLSAGF